jgi:hypothetical protein
VGRYLEAGDRNMEAGALEPTARTVGLQPLSLSF